MSNKFMHKFTCHIRKLNQYIIPNCEMGKTSYTSMYALGENIPSLFCARKLDKTNNINVVKEKQTGKKSLIKFHSFRQIGNESFTVTTRTICMIKSSKTQTLTLKIFPVYVKVAPISSVSYSFSILGQEVSLGIKNTTISQWNRKAK